MTHWVAVDSIDHFNPNHASDRALMIGRWREGWEVLHRPHYDGGWCAGDDLHEWLESRQIQYQLDWRENRFVIGVPTPQLALLVRLVWGI